MSISTDWLVLIKISERRYSLNPVIVIFKLYVEGFNCEKEYRPTSLVLTSRDSPVAVFVSVTLAPIITALLDSVTTPLMLPVNAWLKMLQVRSSSVEIARNALRIRLSFFWSVRGGCDN